MTTRQKGFTLSELMITLAIIGVLAGLAWQQYNKYILRTGRSEATSMLLDVAAREERFHVQTGHYVIDSNQMADLGLKSLYSKTYATGTGPSDSRYTLSIATGDTDDSFRLTATVRPDGPQAADPVCRQFSLDDTGAKGHDGDDTDPGGCW